MSYAPGIEPNLYQQVGYLTLSENGAILSSGGDLENDEERAETFFRLVSIHRNADKFFDEGCTRISVNYKDHSYVICLSNKKIHIVKKSVSLVNDDDSFVVSTNIPVNNSINS